MRLSIRNRLRHRLLSVAALSYTTLGILPRSLHKNRIQFLYGHSLETSEATDFRALLSLLLNHHHPISYTSAAALISGEELSRPYFTFSFDDGIKSCIRAAEIMDEFGVKACFFVCPSIIGVTDRAQVAEFCLRRLRTRPQEFLTWDDIDRLLRGGHEIGAHTMTHPDLARVSKLEALEEIGSSYTVLSKQIGEVKHFSWPFGRFSNFSREVANLVYETGFATCASAERGCHISQPPAEARDVCIRRDHIVPGWPSEHVEYFLARASRTASQAGNSWPPDWSSPRHTWGRACE
jgi:peptidoglycan/xylan/chitin deacetylase (PgdA/CDA1 family)